MKMKESVTQAAKTKFKMQRKKQEIPRRNYWKCRKHSRRREEKCRRQQKKKPENARTEAKNLKKELLDVQKACKKEHKGKRAARNEMEKVKKELSEAQKVLEEVKSKMKWKTQWIMLKYKEQIAGNPGSIRRGKQWKMGSKKAK